MTKNQNLNLDFLAKIPKTGAQIIYLILNIVQNIALVWNNFEMTA